jgi:hypothetical protein
MTERSCVKESMTPKEMLDTPMIWSTLMARLTGTDPEYDLEIIDGFCEAFEIPQRVVWAKIRCHLHRSTMLQ